MSLLRILGLVVAVTLAAAVVGTACGSSDRPELTAVEDGESTSPTEVLVVDDEEEATGDRTESAELVAGGSSARAAVAASGPPLVVFDTDMGPDIDDALALAMLHTYQARGQAEIAAVTLSRNSLTGARFIDALNTWYGHPDIPLGMDRRSPYVMDEATSYVTLADRWPHDATDGEVADGVTVLRRVLARAVDEGRAVRLVQVGFSGNTAALLDSGPDAISPLSGPELVVESGVLLSIMAGSVDNPRIEFNVANDVAAARRLFEAWPGDLVLSPFELGYDILYPYAAIRDRLPDGDRHPLRQAYEFRDHEWHADAPPFYDMRSWDLTSVMHGVERDAGWFPLSDWGTVVLDGEGRTTFQAGQGRHRVLDRSAMTVQDVDRVRAEMIELVSAPPA